jgi:type I restriction enzyme S subunit
MRYTVIPKEISLREVHEKCYSLSPSQYKRVLLPNPNRILVKDFLNRHLKRTDLGLEIGSINYLDQSHKFFFRTKGLQPHSYLPEVNSESLISINPKAFIDYKLKEGDLIISKDSNIGEAIILDQDYPNWMLSGALYRLPVIKWKYYLFAFLKHDSFREQLNFMVPKSATIRHAKTIFLDCQIPLPRSNCDSVIGYVEELVKSVIEIEKEVRRKHQHILDLIDNELDLNQKNTFYDYEFPSLSNIQAAGRFDTNLFTRKFKTFEFKIKNYLNGFASIEQLDFEIFRGQNLQITSIGKSIYSDKYYPAFYTLMLPNIYQSMGQLPP